VRISISAKDLKNLQYIVGFDISIPAAIRKAEEQAGYSISQERVEELSRFLQDMWARLMGREDAEIQ
jgi:hypothetical protein